MAEIELNIPAYKSARPPVFPGSVAGLSTQSAGHDSGVSAWDVMDFSHSPIPTIKPALLPADFLNTSIDIEEKGEGARK